MKKSSIPTIMIWGFYSLFTGIFLFLATMAAGSDLGFGVFPGLVAGFVVMLLLGLLVRGSHIAVQRWCAVEKGGKMTLPFAMVGNIFLIVCLVGMAVLRLSLFRDVVSDPAFEMAKVTGEGFAPTVPHGGMAIYLWLLHDAMLLLGNKAFAAIVLQVLLVLCAALSLYCGVRKLSGILPALLTVVFIGFAPYMFLETQRLTPLLLFFIFYGLCIRCIASLPERMCGTRELSGKVFAGMHYLVTGLLIGFCCYLDAAGVTLLIYLTGIICFDSLKKEDEVPADIFGNGVLVFVCCVLTAVIGYVVSHGIHSLGGGSLGGSISRQLELYLPGRFHIPMTADAGVIIWDVPVLAALMSVGVFSFWYSRKIQNKSLWLFAAALLMLMQCFGMDSAGYFNSYALLYLFCVVMAGSSVAELFMVNKTVQTYDELSDAALGEDTNMSLAVEDEEVSQMGIGLNYEKLEVEQESPLVIEYIDNPLPLPKKKEHKVLDYDYEVPDDDDFDIQ